METQTDGQRSDQFEIAEIAITRDSNLTTHTLEELQFRRTFGATVIGIRRGEESITTILPVIQLQKGDCLIVVDKAETVDALK